MITNFLFVLMIKPIYLETTLSFEGIYDTEYKYHMWLNTPQKDVSEMHLPEKCVILITFYHISYIRPFRHFA